MRPMEEPETLVLGLLDRYARYHALLDQVAQAIDARAQDTLSILEIACGQVLNDIQVQWAELASGLRTRPFDAGPPETSWALLKSAMGRAAEQLSLNQAALAQWAGEIGATLQESKVRGAALRAYGAVTDEETTSLGAQV